MDLVKRHSAWLSALILGFVVICAFVAIGSVIDYDVSPWPLLVISVVTYSGVVAYWVLISEAADFRRQLIAVLVAVGMGGAGLLVSYFLYTNEAWSLYAKEEAPLGLGGWIEFVRYVGVVLVGWRVLGVHFRKTLKELVVGGSSAKRVLSTRFVFVAAICLALVFVLYFISFTGPGEMVRWVEERNLEEGQGWVNLGELPVGMNESYYGYAAHALFGYVGLAAPLLFVPFARVFADYPRSLAMQKTLAKKLEHGSEDDVRRWFEKHWTHCRDIGVKYLELPVWVLCLLVFEILVGRHSVTDPGSGAILFSALLIILTLVCVLIPGFFYEHAYRTMSRRYQDGRPGWLQGRDVLALYLTVLRASVAGVILIFLGSAGLVGVTLQFLAD